MDRGLGQFRQYLASDKNACLYAIKTVERVAAACATDDQIQALASEIEELRSVAREALDPTLFKLVNRAATETAKKLRKVRSADASAAT